MTDEDKEICINNQYSLCGVIYKRIKETWFDMLLYHRQLPTNYITNELWCQNTFKTIAIKTKE